MFIMVNLSGDKMSSKSLASKGYRVHQQEISAKREILLIRVGRLMKDKAQGDVHKQAKKIIGFKKKTLFKLETIEKRVMTATDMGELNRWENKIQNHEDFIALNNNHPVSGFFRKLG